MKTEFILILALALLLLLTIAATVFLIIRRRGGDTVMTESLPRPKMTGGYSGSAGGMSTRDRFLTDNVDNPDEYDDLISRLEYLFENEKIFLDADIRISDVADRLSTTKNHLSKAIGIKTGKNFCQLLHSYRVREAMRLYTANQKLSISQLCKQVGFNSMTTFNTAFGRKTRSPPAEWCKNFRKNSVRQAKYGIRKKD